MLTNYCHSACSFGDWMHQNRTIRIAKVWNHIKFLSVQYCSNNRSLWLYWLTYFYGMSHTTLQSLAVKCCSSDTAWQHSMGIEFVIHSFLHSFTRWKMPGDGLLYVMDVLNMYYFKVTQDTCCRISGCSSHCKHVILSNK